MKNRNQSMVPAAVTLFALLMTGAAVTGTAQTAKPVPGKMPEHQDGMKGMKGMNDMMGGPHQVLAMAYRDNLVTFAKALRGQVSQSKPVDLEIARPATAEMRRSFDQMRQHHQAHLTSMSGHGDSAMSAMMQHMETHLATLGEHLTALESDVNASAPDAKRVSMHTAAILAECASMSAKHANAKPHQMK